MASKPGEIDLSDKHAELNDWEYGFTDDFRGEIRLRYATWPKGRTAKRFIIYVNGRTEWIEKYAELPKWLEMPDDCCFLTWDHRGQGASGGERSWVDSYESFARDAASIIEKVVGPLPYVQFAHSMGSLVSCIGVMKGLLHPKSLVLCSPLFQLPQKPMPEILARPVSWLMSMTPFSTSGTGAGKHHKADFENNRLTHDESAFRRIQNTPYPCPSASFGWVNQTYRATDFCHRITAISTIKIPVLVLAGEDERVVDPEGFESWVSQAKTVLKTPLEYHVIPDGRHELFSEAPSIRQLAIDQVKGWFGDFLR